MKETKQDTKTTPSDKSADPIALTFFLTPIQRRCVLRKLKELGPDRAASLLTSLSLSPLITTDSTQQIREVRT